MVATSVGGGNVMRMLNTQQQHCVWQPPVLAHWQCDSSFKLCTVALFSRNRFLTVRKELLLLVTQGTQWDAHPDTHPNHRHTRPGLTLMPTKCIGYPTGSVPRACRRVEAGQQRVEVGQCKLVEVGHPVGTRCIH